MSPRVSLLIALIVSLMLHLTLLAAVPSWPPAPEGPSTALRIRLASVQGPPAETEEKADKAENPPKSLPVKPQPPPARPTKAPKKTKLLPPAPSVPAENSTAVVLPPTEERVPEPETNTPVDAVVPSAESQEKSGEATIAPHADADTKTGSPAQAQANAGGDPAPGNESIPLQTPTQATEVLKFPRTGSIRYTIKMGNGFMVGEARHQWTVDNDHYRIDAVTQTSGLAGIIRPIRMEISSEGHIIHGILTPDHFKVVKNGTETGENASFDWAAHEVRIGKEGKLFQLATGAQDLLSFHYYYVGGIPPKSDTVVYVATGKKYERFALEVVGEEKLELPAGRFHTLHLRAPGERITEIWIALDLLSLPVRVRYTEKNGDTFDETATHIQIAEDH